MTAEHKLAAAAWPLVSAAGTIDVRWALAMALGMLGGWLARIGFSIESKKSWSEIRQDLVVSLLISIGSAITVLYFAQLLAAGALGVAAIGFAVTLTGTRAVAMLRDWVFLPILERLRAPGGRP